MQKHISLINAGFWLETVNVAMDGGYDGCAVNMRCGGHQVHREGFAAVVVGRLDIWDGVA